MRLLLFGRELGAEPDPGLTSLVGELALLPPLELVRTLGRLGASGSIELDHGAYIEMDAGRVVSASVGAARGAKAFCRLARRRDGPFRVRLGAPPPSVAEDPAAIHSELNPLLIEAIASHGTKPREYEAKLFGGGNMFPGKGKADAFDVGTRNADIAMQMLARHGIVPKATSLGQYGYRNVYFDVGTGNVWVRHVTELLQEVRRTA